MVAMDRLAALGLKLSILGLALGTALACGDSGGGASEDAGDGDSGASGCATAMNCVAPQVCEPVSGNCVVPGAPCTGHDECVNDTYCDAASGTCLPSAVGTPCAGPANCDGECIGGFCGCDGVAHERNLEALPLDIHLVLDRTGSMGTDCAYDPATNATAPVASKACYATYALADYLIDVSPAVDTKLAFDLMSTSANSSCNGTGYFPALIPSTSLPVTLNSTLVQQISDEDFSGGFSTRIESALKGISIYTTMSKVADREMIGVLITDGEATACDENINNLAQIAGDHLTNNGIRTFIIGMTGAIEANLEAIAIAGGADPHNDFCGSLTPPCHYWNIGDGSGTVLASALQAIAEQAAPLPCEIDVSGLTPPEGETLDYSLINVTLTEGASVVTIPQVPDAASCPASQMAWYYDDPGNPSTIHLCQFACDGVSVAGDGASLNVVAGCTGTVVIVD